MIKMFTLDEIIDEIEESRKERKNNNVSDILSDVSDIIRDNEYEEITDARAIAEILNLVRPRAKWQRIAKGNWCCEYVCSGCGGGNCQEQTTYCADCGALMED